jgi:hypothetical protein
MHLTIPVYKKEDNIATAGTCHNLNVGGSVGRVSFTSTDVRYSGITDIKQPTYHEIT